MAGDPPAANGQENADVPASVQEKPAAETTADSSDGGANSPAPIAPLNDSVVAPPRATVSAKMLRYAERVIERHDANGDRVLDESEWRQMRGDPQLADGDGDGRITLAEFAQHVADYAWRRAIRLAPPRFDSAQGADDSSQVPAGAVGDSTERSPEMRTNGVGSLGGAQAPAGPAADTGVAKPDARFYVSQNRLPQGLPAWFLERDQNGDGQLTLAEYSPKGITAEVREFAKLDADGDGVLTVREHQQRATVERPSAPPATPE